MALAPTVISKIPVALLCITTITTKKGLNSSKSSVTEQILQALLELNNMALMKMAHVSFSIYKMQ